MQREDQADHATCWRAISNVHLPPCNNHQSLASSFMVFIGYSRTQNSSRTGQAPDASSHTRSPSHRNVSKRPGPRCPVIAEVDHGASVVHDLSTLGCETASVVKVSLIPGARDCEYAASQFLVPASSLLSCDMSPRWVGVPPIHGPHGAQTFALSAVTTECRLLITKPPFEEDVQFKWGD